MTTVRTRFAPSPTGELHLGNARIAVLNWLFARHSGGQFVLRIEDTDVERNVPGAEDEITTSLRRLGIDWDEGPDVGGDYGPYRQSERTSIYQDYARRLMDSGRAYRCYCTPEELEAKKQAALSRGKPSVYDGTCRDLSPEEDEKLRQLGLKASVRFSVPKGSVAVEDVVRGEIVFDAEEFGDFVILKSDGLPTYNFGVVIDDVSMRISHVIRGAGHLANTPRQIMLYQALNEPSPAFIHVPHVLGPDGAALSKRAGARGLREYLDEGYHPDALVNYLSLLSWSSPSGDEVLPPARLISEIDLNRIGSSDVRLDPDKLEWLSGEYMRKMDVEALADRIAARAGSDVANLPRDTLVRIVKATQERITTFGGVERFLPQFQPPDPMRWDAEAEESLSAPGVPRTLAAVLATLRRVEDWDGETALTAVRVAGKEVDAKGRSLFMPVRAAITGTTQGPELIDIFDVQGKATTLRVLEQACARAKQAEVAE
ncbi:MAG: glutamate--tRNA ligase [Gemmatimonadales bacterium]|jgi:nondiscriminating glutamyl-tRNA synthetase